MLDVGPFLFQCELLKSNTLIINYDKLTVIQISDIHSIYESL